MRCMKISLRLVSTALVVLGVTIDIILIVAGHMHRHAHRPLWASVLSWLFIACFLSLAGVGVVAVRRRLLARRK
jgi:hypothetical protein